MMRWKFHDPTGALPDYTFTVNPNARDDPELDEPMEALPQQVNGGLMILPDPPSVGNWSFTGIVYKLADVTSFETWMNAGYTIQVTDHLGQQFRIQIEDLETQRKASLRNPERQQITVTCLMLGKV